jgi:predicted nicotinamide N-methyase
MIDVGNGDSDSSAAQSNTAHQPLVIEQDRTVGKGGFVWDAGFILAESVLNMEQKETEWLGNHQETKIIELGAGTGVTSLMIARAVPTATVHLTDLPQLQPLLSKNCTTCPDRATHGVLEWGKPVGDDAPYDIILGADVVAGIYDASGLAKTIYDLSHEKTVVYLACRERLAGVIDRFESHMHELFTKVERRAPDSSNKSPNVFIMRVSGKRVYGTDEVEDKNPHRGYDKSTQPSNIRVMS